MLVLVCLVGKYCESGDIIVWDIWVFDDIWFGDLVVVVVIGVYCYLLLSCYNMVGCFVVVVVYVGNVCLVLCWEMVDDLLSLEVR